MYLQQEKCLHKVHLPDMVNSESSIKYWFQNTLTKVKLEVGLQIFLNSGKKYQYGKWAEVTCAISRGARSNLSSCDVQFLFTSTGLMEMNTMSWEASCGWWIPMWQRPSMEVLPTTSAWRQAARCSETLVFDMSKMWSSNRVKLLRCGCLKRTKERKETLK